MTDHLIVLAADHAGRPLKTALASVLAARGYRVLDLGADGEEAVDYPDFAGALARQIERGAAECGVLICGSGIGMSIAANRHRQLRAALCRDAESARLARLHNDANVLVLGGRTTAVEDATACLDAFLTTPFEGGRHARRVAKLS
jgi:ribose 5-phosphate isomerase B